MPAFVPKEQDMRNPEVGKTVINQVPNELSFGAVESVEQIEAWKQLAASESAPDFLSGKITGTDNDPEYAERLAAAKARNKHSITISSRVEDSGPVQVVHFSIGDKVYSRKNREEGTVKSLPGANPEHPTRYRVKLSKDGRSVWIKPRYLVKL